MYHDTMLAGDDNDQFIMKRTGLKSDFDKIPDFYKISKRRIRDDLWSTDVLYKQTQSKQKMKVKVARMLF